MFRKLVDLEIRGSTHVEKHENDWSSVDSALTAVQLQSVSQSNINCVPAGIEIARTHEAKRRPRYPLGHLGVYIK